jgi:hypothetical protein
MEMLMSRRIGGFVARNAGEVINCYSIVKIKTKKKVVGGFAGENNKDIINCYYSGKIHRLNGGISGMGKGKTKNSHYFHKKALKKKTTGKLCDSKLAIKYTDIKNSADIQKIGYDTENIWEYIGGSAENDSRRKEKFRPERFMRFIPDKWLFNTVKSPLHPLYAEELPLNENEAEPPILLLSEPDEENTAESEFDDSAAYFIRDEAGAVVIKGAEELFELAKRINEGDQALASSYIKIENDIDLKGKNWTPVGIELAAAFTGLFDGNGHTIKNFVIKSKKHKELGFFGYLKGEVYNLTVDCSIKGSKRAVTGGIAAHCDGGVIGCCAVVSFTECRKAGAFGGLVGSNTGRIFQSYTAGKIKNAFPLWILLLPLLLLPLLLLYTNSVIPEYIPVFNPIPIDSEVRQVERAVPNIGSNLVSFRFERTINVSLSSGECILNFLNPGISNHDVVIELQLTGDWNRNALIAYSGSVPPGYELESIRLLPAGDRVELFPGQYEGVINLIFYDMNTHSRAHLESQLPVVVNIQE